MRPELTQALTPFGPQHRRRRRHFLFVLLLLPLLSGAFAAPAGQVAGDELAEAQAKQDELLRRVEEQKALIEAINVAQGQLKGAIENTTTELQAINADLTKVRESIAAMIVQIDGVKSKYDALVTEIAALNFELSQLVEQERVKRLELRERKALLADRLRAAYDTDRVSLLETFLSGGSFADMLAEVSYHLDVGAQDRSLAERIKEDQETLASLHASVEATRRQSVVLRQETAVQKILLDRQLAELEDAQERLAILEAQTEAILAEQEAAYDTLAANKTALAEAMRKASAAQFKVAAEVRDLIARQQFLGNIPAEYIGTLEWPLIGAISGEFGCSAYSGYAPGYGCAHFHNGIDIVAPCGTEITAAGPGRIAYIGWNYADGFDPAWIVVIAHASNLQTWYAHMQPSYPPGITAGAEVTAGQLIGYEGNTGNSTGCHLHWMVLLNGQYHNARLFLAPPVEIADSLEVDDPEN